VRFLFFFSLDVHEITSGLDLAEIIVYTRAWLHFSSFFEKLRAVRGKTADHGFFVFLRALLD